MKKALVIMSSAVLMLSSMTMQAHAESEQTNFTVLPTSIGIDFPKIDANSVSYNFRLTVAEKESLEEYSIKYGVPIGDVDTMTSQEGKDFFSAQPVQNILGSRSDILSANPRFAEFDMSDWTYGDWQRHSKYLERRAPNQALKDDNISLLMSRGLTVEDAWFIRMEYGEEGSELLSDKEIKEALENEYKRLYLLLMSLQYPRREFSIRGEKTCMDEENKYYHTFSYKVPVDIGAYARNCILPQCRGVDYIFE